MRQPDEETNPLSSPSLSGEPKKSRWHSLSNVFDREKAYQVVVQRGTDTFQAAVKVADQSTPLNLRTASFKVKLGAMVVLLTAFLSGLVWSILENIHCTEENGCLTCSILNEKSKELYEKADNVDKKVALGILNQELISSCTKLDIAATKSVIKKLLISDELWQIIVEDMVQLNLCVLFSTLVVACLSACRRMPGKRGGP